MKKNEAVTIIKTIIDSIEKEPAQFHIDVRVIGLQISSSGGIGQQIIAAGGGPGSTGGAQIQFAHKIAIKGMEQQVLGLITELKTMVTELNRPSPDKGTIRGILDKLNNSWVPPLITSVIANVITKSIGL